MLSYNANQNTIAAAGSKAFVWLVTITTSAPTTYYWSLVNKTYDGNTFEFKIIAGTFSGIKLFASESEHGAQTPNTLTFQATNASNTLTGTDFIDASVKVELLIDDGVTGDTIMGTWKFNVKRCNAEQQKLNFECEDFIQAYLKGDYPNTTLVKDAFLSNDTDQSLCVPVPVGNPFIPLVSILSGGSRYYLLGPASKSYDILKVRSPRAMGYKHDWTSGSFTFTQSSKTGLDGISYRVFTALIAEGGNHGLFQNGDSYYPIPTDFTRDDTKQINGSETGSHTGANGAAVLTDSGASWGVDKLIGAYVVNTSDGSYGKITDNTGTTVTATLSSGTWDEDDNYVIGGPASIIKWILEDFGISSSNIDDTSFGTAEAAFASLGLVWNGAFTSKQDRKAVIASLLSQCNSYLVIREKICLFNYSKTSQKTIDDSDITKPQDVGADTFRATRLERVNVDNGFINWQPDDEIQDEWQKIRVSAKYSSGTHTETSGDEVLTDSNQDWPTNSLVGGTVSNTTDGSSAIITANTSTTVTGSLSGGEEDHWDNGDAYTIDVSNNISEDTLFVNMIQDDQDAQLMGMLYFQRKFLAKSQISFTSKGTLLALEPGDTATIDEANYGGTYKFLIKSVHIKEDLSMAFTGKTYGV